MFMYLLSQSIDPNLSPFEQILELLGMPEFTGNPAHVELAVGTLAVYAKTLSLLLKKQVQAERFVLKYISCMHTEKTAILIL